MSDGGVDCHATTDRRHVHPRRRAPSSVSILQAEYQLVKPICLAWLLRTLFGPAFRPFIPPLALKLLSLNSLPLGFLVQDVSGVREERCDACLMRRPTFRRLSASASGLLITSGSKWPRVRLQSSIAARIDGEAVAELIHVELDAGGAWDLAREERDHLAQRPVVPVQERLLRRQLQAVCQPICVVRREPLRIVAKNAMSALKDSV